MNDSSSTKTYTAKKNAMRAAREALGDDAIQGVDYVIVEAGKGFAWQRKTVAAAVDPAPRPYDVALRTKNARAILALPVRATLPIGVIEFEGSLGGFIDSDAMPGWTNIPALMSAIAAGQFYLIEAEGPHSENVYVRPLDAVDPAPLQIDGVDIVVVDDGAGGLKWTKADAEEAVGADDEEEEAAGPEVISAALIAEMEAVAAMIADGSLAAVYGSAADPKPVSKREAVVQAAKAGVLPQPPDFSANTHARFRGKLAKVVKLVEDGDLDGLREFPINPISTSPKAIARYRDLAVLALTAKGNGHAAQ